MKVMKGIFKISLIILALISLNFVALANKGSKKKVKAKVNLAINTGVSLRNSLMLNLKSQAAFKGAFLKSTGATTNNKAAVSFQRGNNIYILPYKTKIITSEAKRGYSGLKLVLRIPR